MILYLRSLERRLLAHAVRLWSWAALGCHMCRFRSICADCWKKDWSKWPRNAVTGPLRRGWSSWKSVLSASFSSGTNKVRSHFGVAVWRSNLAIAMGAVIGVAATATATGYLVKRRKKPLPPPPDTHEFSLCPTCRRQLNYISQYQRWYCQNCENTSNHRALRFVKGYRRACLKPIQQCEETNLVELKRVLFHSSCAINVNVDLMFLIFLILSWTALILLIFSASVLTMISWTP